jgi:hypothetical protein
MFRDHDHWPVTCREHGCVWDQEIGVLKAAEYVSCPRCGSELAFCSEAFQHQLRSAEETYNYAVRAAYQPGWDHLRQRAIPPDAAFAQTLVASAQRTIRQYALTSVLTSKRGVW